MSENENRIEVYLDDQTEPYASFAPPERFELDVTALEDGPHRLRIVAIDRSGRRGIRNIPFEVRNGPGIAVDGIRENDVVEGNLNILVNAYGGAYEDKWEPSRAETPLPIPTWAWVVGILIGAWALYYAVAQWRPTPQYANTPTYRSMALGPGQAETTAAKGAELYRTSCASCHQNNGQGVPNTFPPLAGDPVVTANDPTAHIEAVLFGKQGGKINGASYATPMPAWEDQLSDQEVAAVINHERTSWGNDAPTVTAADVAKIRKRGKQ